MRHPLVHGLLILGLAACAKTATDDDVVGYLRDQPAPARAALIRRADARVETPGVIRRGDQSLTLLGPTLAVGDKMPDATLADANLGSIGLASLRGKVVVLSVVPSIDTRVCETQTHKVSDAIGQMPAGVEVFTVSRDLPFAQTRFVEEARTLTKMGSDFHGGTFGRAFGLDVKETGLLARSVWVIGKDGTIAYRELVTDQGTEPDYDAMLAAVKRVAGA